MHTLFLHLCVVTAAFESATGSVSFSERPPSSSPLRHNVRLPSSLRKTATNERLLALRGGLRKKAPAPAEQKTYAEAVVATPEGAPLKGILTVIGGVLAHMTLGTLYSWGNFMAYAPAHLRYFDGKTHTGRPADALFVIPVLLVAQMSAMPLGPAMFKWLGSPGKALLVGCFLMDLGVFLSSFAQSLGVFMLFYSIFFGFGVGLAYTVPLVAGWGWFPEKKGLVTGLTLMGFGAGGFLFNHVGTYLANPGKLEAIDGVFPDEVTSRFPYMLRTLAVTYLALATTGSLLMSSPPKRVGAAGPVGLTVREALCSRQFWAMWGMILFAATAGLNVVSAYKVLASSSEVLNFDSYLAMVGALGSLFNGLGRLTWGSLVDRMGFRKPFAALCTANGFGSLLYTLSLTSQFWFCVMTLFFCFNLGGIFAIFPTANRQVFGSNGATIYGFMFSAFGTSSIIALAMTSQLAAKLGWDTLIRIMGGLSSVSLLLVALFQPLPASKFHPL